MKEGEKEAIHRREGGRNSLFRFNKKPAGNLDRSHARLRTGGKNCPHATQRGGKKGRKRPKREGGEGRREKKRRKWSERWLDLERNRDESSSKQDYMGRRDEPKTSLREPWSKV